MEPVEIIYIYIYIYFFYFFFYILNVIYCMHLASVT